MFKVPSDLARESRWTLREHSGAVNVREEWLSLKAMVKECPSDSETVAAMLEARADFWRIDGEKERSDKLNERVRKIRGERE